MLQVAGSNLQRQWFDEKLILKNFSIIAANHNGFCLEKSKIILTSWSYNIFYLDPKYYIVGSVFGNDNQCLEVLIPKSITEIILIGNEFKLYLISQTTNDIWILNLSVARTWEWEHKILNTNIETSIEAKKRKLGDAIIKKADLTVSALILLYSDGSIYEWPNKINTKNFSGKIIDIVSGYEHILILSETGFVYSWGNGRRCQLGHGEIISLEEPKLIEALAGIKIKHIKAGGWHSMALSEHGDLYAWGWNDTGQLGILEKDEENILKKEHVKNVIVPTLVEFYDDKNETLLVNVTQVACGSRHSAVISEDSNVWTSGFNSYGQLGICPEQYKSMNCFKKALKCNIDSKLLCGPWSTVVIS